jgi:thiamine transport system substrate-binding protein
MRRLTILFAAVLLAACGQPGASSPTAPPIITPETSNVPVATSAPAADKTLVVMAHDSFSVSESVLAAFEQQYSVKVQVLKDGDAGAALNKAILSKASPLADVFFGVDNTFLSRALAADIFLPYASPALADIPADLRLDPSDRLLPVDYGYVSINYDKAALKQASLAPPSALEDLTKPAWKGKLVVENPTTSSPGLAFMLATISHFGETGSYTWKDYWRDLRANEVFISNDWTDAYYTQFSGSSGKGPYPLVVSYATSPAAEVYFSEGKLTEPPTGNLLVPGGSFRQVEFVGILKGTQREELAKQFVDFMLGPQLQADIPLQMFVYPALPSAPQPEVFAKFAEVPAQATGLAPAQIDAGREGWIKAWTEIVLR